MSDVAGLVFAVVTIVFFVVLVAFGEAPPPEPDE